MAFKKSQAVHLAPLPVRQWFYRASVVMMVTFGLIMMVMSRADNAVVGKLRTSITDIIAPILEVAASPMDAVAGAGGWLTDMARLRADNIALRNQNLQLLEWQSIAKTMEAENASLRALLSVVPQQKRNYITARVVSDLGGPYMYAALINGGASQGIEKNQPVINESGLVGRVVEAGQTSARVLLLGDINSRVPVMAEKSREKSILSGNNTDLPSLSYLAADSKIAVGERVVTSGDGGIFPPGVPVGVVTAIEEGVVKVQPFVDATKMEFVSIIDYSL